MVRHIRDPVTGRCVVCDQNHGPNQVVNTGPKGPSSWDNVKKKIIYMNAFNDQRSPSPTRSRAPSPSRQRPQTTNEIIYVNGHPSGPHHPHDYDKRNPPRDYDQDSGISGNSVRSQSRVHLIGAATGPGYYGGGQNRYPTEPRYQEREPQYPDRDRSPRRDRSPERYRQGRDRTPSPSGAGCCGRSGRRGGDRNYGHYKDGRVNGYPGQGRGLGAAANRSSVYNGHANNWGRRRCCACLVGLLLLLLLAGLAIGLYFGITAANTQSATETTNRESQYPGGYYVDGVYVVPVTEAPEQTYFVYGLDTPCNPYNNNTAGSNNATYPNCQDVTTRIVPSNYTTPTPVIVAVVTTPSLAHGITSSMLLVSISLFLQMLHSFKFI